MSNVYVYTSEEFGYSVVIEDDNRVAYAYLMRDKKIVGDVWLYNRGEPPNEPEWRDTSMMPFANAREYAREYSIQVIPDLASIVVSWLGSKDGLQKVELHVDNEIFAAIAPGARPGWSRNAIKDGPLAQVLRIDE